MFREKVKSGGKEQDRVESLDYTRATNVPGPFAGENAAVNGGGPEDPDPEGDTCDIAEVDKPVSEPGFLSFQKIFGEESDTVRNFISSEGDETYGNGIPDNPDENSIGGIVSVAVVREATAGYSPCSFSCPLTTSSKAIPFGCEYRLCCEVFNIYKRATAEVKRDPRMDAMMPVKVEVIGDQDAWEEWYTRLRRRTVIRIERRF